MVDDLSAVKYDNSKDFFDAILVDFANAKKLIYLETFKFTDESLGKKIINILIEKAKIGVEIKLLLDDWGTTARKDFFNDLINVGGSVKYFRKFKYFTKSLAHTFSYNNRRDHRKLILIDDDITYVGSSNITDYSFNWREFNLRIKNKKVFDASKKFFLDMFKIRNFFFHSAKKHVSPIKFRNLELIRDVPSLRFKKIRNKLMHHIRKAKKQIIIETPYFVPDFFMIYHLQMAAKRGVEVIIILPKKSDVKAVDILMKKYYGILHKKGIKLLFYYKHFNHSKVCLFDSDYFCFGSANFDYRSFIYQYELNLAGSHPVILEQVKKHLDKSIDESILFDFKVWKNRSFTHRVAERILGLVKKIF